MPTNRLGGGPPFCRLPTLDFAGDAFDVAATALADAARAALGRHAMRSVFLLLRSRANTFGAGSPLAASMSMFDESCMVLQS